MKIIRRETFSPDQLGTILERFEREAKSLGCVGRIFSSAGDGISIFTPDGKLIGKILVPETPANLCIGGADGKTLFITARSSLYSMALLTEGAK